VKSGPRGYAARVSEAEETYTAQEASRILRTTERTVRRRLERGDLEGTRDSTTGRWKVAAHSVTAAMPERPPKASQEPAESPQEAADLRLRESLQRELGRLEGQRELEAVAQSTLREQLERERERADRLEEELRDARRSWWRRIFGRRPDTVRRRGAYIRRPELPRIALLRGWLNKGRKKAATGSVSMMRHPAGLRERL
jgi:hypothetical protein